MLLNCTWWNYDLQIISQSCLKNGTDSSHITFTHLFLMLILLQLSITTESQTLFTKVFFQFQDTILDFNMHFIVISTQSPLSNYFFIFIIYCSVQFSSFTQSCPTLCNPINHSTPGLPVHHQLPEFTQTHVHQGNDTIQPSHPLLSPSPPALNLSQHQGLFTWVSSLH